MANPYDVIVVGAGIAGASTAYHLKRSGAGDVLLPERQAPAAGGTGKSAAAVRRNYSTELMILLATRWIVAGEVVGRHEVVEVDAELSVAVVVIALDGGVLDRAFIRSTWPIINERRYYS